MDYYLGINNVVDSYIERDCMVLLGFFYFSLTRTQTSIILKVVMVGLKDRQ